MAEEVHLQRRTCTRPFESNFYLETPCLLALSGYDQAKVRREHPRAQGTRFFSVRPFGARITRSASGLKVSKRVPKKRVPCTPLRRIEPLLGDVCSCHSRSLLAACGKEIVAFSPLAARMSKLDFPVTLTLPSRSTSTTPSNRLAASRNHKHHRDF